MAGCGTKQLYPENYLSGEQTATISVKKGTKGVYILDIYQDRYKEHVAAM